MARPPLPADQRRTRYVALRLTEAEAAPVQAIADAEYGGNLSVAIRVLLSEAATARTIRAQPDQEAVVICVECGVNPVSTPGTECADCRRNS